jgi:tRNA threonylcarbamoyladenosine biosynthesis protein TsaE
MTIEYHISQIEEVAQKILMHYPTVRCFAFYAEMGSGKTTLIRAFCRQLGVTENTSSPTFSIINEYRGYNSQEIYHSDWYRLKGVQDAIEAGVQDILENQNAFCFIEWPEIAEELLGDKCLTIKISFINNDTRRLEI